MFPRLDRRWAGWLIAVLVVGAALAGVALAGGFAPADARRVPTVPVGSVIETENWHVIVQDAVWTDTRLGGTPMEDPVLRLRTKLTNTSDQTRPAPRRGLITIRVGEYEIDDIQWTAAPDRALGFDPWVPREAWAELSLEAMPSAVVVLVRTERTAWSYADGRATEALGSAVAKVELPVIDQREQP